MNFSVALRVTYHVQLLAKIDDQTDNRVILRLGNLIAPGSEFRALLKRMLCNRVEAGVVDEDLFVAWTDGSAKKNDFLPVDGRSNQSFYFVKLKVCFWVSHGFPLHLPLILPSASSSPIGPGLRLPTCWTLALGSVISSSLVPCIVSSCCSAARPPSPQSCL